MDIAGVIKGEGLTEIRKSAKQLIQLTWVDIVIKAMPAQSKCCKSSGANMLTKEKIIIDHVHGTVQPGQFLAIIGASGAGKTTLLNFLSGREISQNLTRTGQIFINHKDKDTLGNFSSYSAYVQQDDILFQTMTVRECLTFAARLKLTASEDEKQERVNHMIKSLKLTKAQNTRIGGPLVKGVSGGERKRTSIGVELITDPNLVFLDEPTTGLDSFTATSVCESLRDLAKKENRTVVTTIHQPNTDIFDIFDRLVLLARGKIIYFNAADKSVEYFSNLGYTCPDTSNPCDYFMSMMSKESIELEHEEDDANAIGAAGLDQAKIDIEYEKLIEFFVNKYHSSELECDPTVRHPEVKEITG